MKRILALLLALCMLMALTACGDDTEGTPAGGGTGTSNNITEDNNTEDGTENGTEDGTGTENGTEDNTEDGTGTEDDTEDDTEDGTGTEDDTEDDTEDGADDTTDDTTVTPHTHSYSSKVTTAATCGKDGVKTFTCSCGDSYTEKIAATGQHSWGSWSTETVALVNRTGTDKRTCSTCSAAETRENTENVLENSFYDPGLGQLFYWGFNYDGSLRVYSLLEYAPYKYSEFVYKETSTDTIYDTLAKVFVLDSSFKDKMRAEGKSNPYYLGYNEANDTFTFEGNNMGSMGNAEPLGYIHNGGKEYTVYYRFEVSALDESPQIYKVVLEFNRTDSFNINNWSLNGEENKYLSFEKVSSVPSDLTK